MSKSYLFFGAFALALAAGVLYVRANSLSHKSAFTAVLNPTPVPNVIGFRRNSDPQFHDVLPWNRYETKKRGESSSMRFATEKRYSCNSGDYDAIAGSLKHSEEKNLLLSLESLSVEDGFKPITMKVSEADFLKGFRGKLEIPANVGPRQLALFLCKDSEKIGRCAVKPIADVNQILREVLTANAEPMPAQSPDRIYYFQYVYVDKSGAFHLFRHSPIAKQAIEILSEKLGKEFPKEQVELERMSLAKADLFSRTLASVPLAHKSDGFQIVLPARDNSHCPSVAELESQLKMYFPKPQ